MTALLSRAATRVTVTLVVSEKVSVWEDDVLFWTIDNVAVFITVLLWLETATLFVMASSPEEKAEVLGMTCCIIEVLFGINGDEHPVIVLL